METEFKKHLNRMKYLLNPLYWKPDLSRIAKELGEPVSTIHDWYKKEAERKKFDVRIHARSDEEILKILNNEAVDAVGLRPSMRQKKTEGDDIYG